MFPNIRCKEYPMQRSGKFTDEICFGNDALDLRNMRRPGHALGVFGRRDRDAQ